MHKHKNLTKQYLSTIQPDVAKKPLIILALGFALSTALFFSYLDHMHSKVASESAYKTSKGYAAILSQFRSLYSSAIINVAQRLDIELTHDYHLKKMSLPLPSTMSLLLNEKITQSGVTNVKQYSPYPFAWRKEVGGLNDSFTKAAWQALSDHPNIPFTRIEEVKGILSVRYAIANTVKPECVSCHNTYTDTPKDNWKSGDLFGVLEIIEPVIIKKNAISHYFTSIKVIFCIVLLIVLVPFYILLGRLTQDRKVLAAVSTQFRQSLTDHKNLQHSLQEANDQSAIQKQKTDLALKEALEANSIKSVFLANISHEIRTPMNAILGYTKILKSNPSIKGESLKSLLIINKSGEHLLNLINDILDIAKLESGASKLHITNFDILDVCNSSVEMFALKASQKRLTLTFVTDINTDTLTVNGDQLKLRQVIINLIGNALKFTSKGRVILKLNIQEDSVFSFSVIDTGTGVHQQYQSSIFDSFNQGESAASCDGVGLGLSISKKYLKLMHSDIQLISTPGIGSKFFFDICLPIQKKTQKLLGHNSSPNHIAQKASKLSNSILIVEDYPVEQSSLYQILNLNGLQVLHSRSTFDALGLLKIESVNLAITDLTNPLINSTLLLQKIKQHYPRLRVIATIDYSLKNNIKHYEHLGFDNVMIKPFSQDHVVSIIAQYFDLEASRNSITESLVYSDQELNTSFELPVEFTALIIEQCDLYLVKEVEALIDRLMEKFPNNDDYFLQLQSFVNNYDLEGLTSFLKSDADVR